MSFDLSRSAVRYQQGGQQAEQRGFPGSVRADDPECLTVPDIERDPAQCFDLAIGLHKPFGQYR